LKSSKDNILNKLKFVEELVEKDAKRKKENSTIPIKIENKKTNLMEKSFSTRSKIEGETNN
jgi:hypothetical protein